MHVKSVIAAHFLSTDYDSLCSRPILVQITLKLRLSGTRISRISVYSEVHPKKRIKFLQGKYSPVS